MAATTSQGKNFTLFMVGLTAVCAGIAFSDSGVAKVVLIVGALILAISLWGLFKIKPLEGKTGERSAARRHETDRRGSGVGRLAVCAFRIAPDGRCGSADGDLASGVCHFARRNHLHTCTGGQQKRHLESLIALPCFLRTRSTESMINPIMELNR